MSISGNLLLEPKDMPVPLGFDTWLTFWMVVLISAINALMMIFACYKLLQVLQQGGYRIKNYFEWFKNTRFAFWGRLVVLSFLSSAALLMTNVLLEDFFIFKIMTYIGLLFYFIFVIFFVVDQFNMPQKAPLKYTNRMTRLTIILFIIIFAGTFFMLNFSSVYIPYFQFGAVGLTPVFMPLFVVLSHYIAYPFEAWNNRRYKKLAEKKLARCKKLIKIGITGSYGKTSVKSILATILGEKYRVCVTPYSFNTPMGLSKTILNDLQLNDEVFIAEMGARYMGDIKYLCDMIKPDIGVLTAVGNQHLATFGTQENIINTKNELAQNLKKNGKMFYNLDNRYCKELFEESTAKKYGANDDYCYASNVKVTSRGSTFKLHINGEEIECHTSLLGKHNVSNIVLCASVAYEMGLNMTEIQAGIEKLIATPHRLAIVPSNNALIVIDDAYNGSVEGARAAMSVLESFEGKKVVITPGLVELGRETFNSNFQLGIDMAKVSDYVIINGNLNYEAIANGLVFGGFDEKHIFQSGNLKQAVEFLPKITNPGDVVLFENDLPDNYT